MSLDLPSGTFTPEQTRLLNDRLRRIDGQLGSASKLTGDLDAQGHKIVNLGDGVDTQDALTLVEAQRRFAGVKKSTSVEEITTVVERALFLIPTNS
jgi:hypothetical protein